MALARMVSSRFCPSGSIFLISSWISWQALSTTALEFLLSSSPGLIVICRSVSCEFLCLTRELNPGALSVFMVMGPECLTGDERSISARFRSCACSDSINLAVVNVEKWSVRSMMSCPCLYDVGMEGSMWVVHLSLGFGADWHLVLLLCDCAGVAIFL